MGRARPGCGVVRSGSRWYAVNVDVLGTPLSLHWQPVEIDDCSLGIYCWWRKCSTASGAQVAAPRVISFGRAGARSCLAWGPGFDTSNQCGFVEMDTLTYCRAWLEAAIHWNAFACLRVSVFLEGLPVVVYCLNGRRAATLGFARVRCT